MLVAHGPADLHNGGRLNKDTLLNEKGEPVGDVDILTGSLPNGTAAPDMNCNNWTSNEEGKAMAGKPEGSSWNSGRPTSGCSQKALLTSVFYCFASH